MKAANHLSDPEKGLGHGIRTEEDKTCQYHKQGIEMQKDLSTLFVLLPEKRNVFFQHQETSMIKSPE